MTALWLAREQEGTNKAPELCRLLADQGINITFVSASSIEREHPHPILFCIESEDADEATRQIKKNKDLACYVVVTKQAVGLLSVFPHQASLSVLGEVLQILKSLDVIVHGFASSIAALTFVIDFDCLQKAVSALADTLDLKEHQIVRQGEYHITQALCPGNNEGDKSGRPELHSEKARIAETIAVYWEPVIRTYGFNLLERHTLCLFNLPMSGLIQWNRALKDVGNQERGFQLVWSLAQQAGFIKFFLLCDDNGWNRLCPLWEAMAGADMDNATFTKSRVDTIFFQGPHFGDRHGIMDYTYKALETSRVPLSAVTCSAASIYLVVPEGWGQKTQQVLGKAFEIPMDVDRRAHHKKSGAD